MIDGLIVSDRIVHIGIVVEDIVETTKKYEAILGVKVGHTGITGDYEETGVTYKDLPSKARCKLAFFQVGETMEIELLEPDHEPSVWRDYLNEHGEGFHHMSFIVKSMDKTIEDLSEEGIPLVQRANFEGGGYAYVDTLAQLKIMTEIMEVNNK